VAIIRLAIPEMSAFSHKLVLSPFFQSYVIDEQTGAGRGGLPKNRMDKIPFPLPPLAEQNRIVAKVDELMELCDRLQAAQTEREQNRDRLVAASLHRLNRSTDDEAANSPEAQREHARFIFNHLPHLTTRPEHIKQLRQTILNLAVRGKLVLQDPNDEPASELLKRMATEKQALFRNGKIPKPKSSINITEDEKQFLLPKGWVWARVWDIAQLITSGSRDWAKYYSSSGAIFVTMGNLSKEHYNLRMDTIRYVNPPKNSEGARTKLEANVIC
jgi:type I restriction enzyme S subunit